MIFIAIVSYVAIYSLIYYMIFNHIQSIVVVQWKSIGVLEIDPLTLFASA